MARLRLAPATSGAPNAQLRRSGADLGLAALRSPARAGDRTGKRAAPGLPCRALSRAARSVLSLAPRRSSDLSKHGLLLPERVASWAVPLLRVAAVAGGQISYAIQGSPPGPLVLYFHGWGDDFRVVLPLEYPSLDAGFRLLVVHRPGYAGTTLEGEVDGAKVDWRSVHGFASAVGALLDQLYGEGRWSVAVIGTSGGAPSALAFAERHPRQTRALLLQAGVTAPWSDAKFVPELLRNSYLTAFRRFGWAGEHVSQIVFGLLVKFRENFLDDADKLKALTGSRFEEATRDPAFSAVVSRILSESAGNRWGELNDFCNVFLAKSA